MQNHANSTVNINFTAYQQKDQFVYTPSTVGQMIPSMFDPNTNTFWVQPLAMVPVARVQHIPA